MRNIIAFFGGLVAVLLIAKAMGAMPEIQGMEYRALAFIYHQGQYREVMDLIDKPFATAEECSATVHELLPKAKIPEGDFIVGGCVSIPKFKSVTT